MMKLRITKKEELDVAVQIICEAKEHLRSQGINQWQSGYPDRKCICDDIEKQRGYFCMSGKDILGYLCIDFEGEPAYETLDGNWKCDDEYAVVHRLAIRSQQRGKGIASLAFSFVQELCMEKGIHSIRVDTDEDNKKMQHILYKSGFEYCGTVWFAQSTKMAFEKIF